MSNLDLTTYRSFLHSLYDKYRKGCSSQKLPMLYLGHTDGSTKTIHIKHYVGCQNGDFVEIIETETDFFDHPLMLTESEVTIKPISSEYQFEVADSSCSNKSGYDQRNTVHQTYRKIKSAKLWEKDMISETSLVDVTFKTKVRRFLMKYKEENDRAEYYKILRKSRRHLTTLKCMEKDDLGCLFNPKDHLCKLRYY